MSIILKNVSKFYGEQKALDNVSFEIKTGEIVGFIGPNGAGKSTTMKIITGYIPQDEGEVVVNENNTKENIIEIKKEIGYLPEHNPLYLDMYVKEYLEYVAGIYKIKNKKQKITDIIKLLGIEREQHKKISALSKGYRQRIGLAQAFIHDPKVLILDEPTSGLDPNQIMEIRDIISSVGKEKTILLSTHIMQEVEAICDRIIVISKGKIVADKQTSEIKTELESTVQTIIVEFDKEISKEKIEKIVEVNKVAHLKDNNWLLESNSEKDIRTNIFNFAVENKIAVISMQKKEKTLEEIFKELTK